MLIYSPKGKAREYSPLALNIYNGCDFGCKYCYTKLITRNNNANIEAKKRVDFIEKLEKELITFNYSEQILLSFICDPYCNADDELRTTRYALALLNKYKQKVAVLTKSGEKCFRDIDIFKLFKEKIKVGSTLTFVNKSDSLAIEKNAATPDDRINTLKILHKNNIKTFVSIEPVIDPEQSLELIRLTLPFVDQFKVGKINYYEKEFTKNIDWHKFLSDAVNILRENNRQFYIKKDLAAFDTDNILTVTEKDHNNFNL